MLLRAQTDIGQLVNAAVNPDVVDIVINSGTDALKFDITNSPDVVVANDDEGVLITMVSGGSCTIKQNDTGAYTLTTGKRIRLNNNSVVFCTYAVPEFSDSVFLRTSCINAAVVLNGMRTYALLALTAASLGILSIRNPGGQQIDIPRVQVDLTDEQLAEIAKKIRAKGIVIT